MFTMSIMAKLYVVLLSVTVYQGVFPASSHCPDYVDCASGNVTCVDGVCLPRCVNVTSSGECLQCRDFRFYGKQCESVCPHTCLNSHCRLINSRVACTEGCVAGKKGDNCDIECPPSCGECSRGQLSSTVCKEICLDACRNGCDRYKWQCSNCQDGFKGRYCNICEDGYWGRFCNETCSPNCRDGCDRDSGHCYYCMYGHRGKQCEQNCFQNCGGCDRQTGKCNWCQSSHRGTHCNITCPPNCSGGCNRHTGECEMCQSGYGGEHCNVKCSSNCTICSRYDLLCQECVVGYRGPFCNVSCPLNCKGSCNKGTGHCYLCLSGYRGVQCNETCPAGCVGECDKDSGMCFQCESGYWGTYCNKTCPFDCNDKCDRDTGACGKCSNCNDTCPTNCRDGCDMNTGVCHWCISGYRGDYCNVPCPSVCMGGCDRETGSCYWCDSGYKGRYCAEKCLNNCHECDRDTGRCYWCSFGYWGKYCNITCPTACIGGCDRNTAVCDICENGYRGRHCNETCPVNCRDGCDRMAAECVNCTNGYTGRTCSIACSPDCHICDYRSGACLQCIDGKKGTFCNESCPGSCTKCDRYLATCIGPCPSNNFYGRHCSFPCSLACNGCKKDTGVCMACVQGYQRIYCDEMCSLCEEDGCNSTTCITRDRHTVSENSNLVLKVSCGILGVLVAVGLILAVIFVARRRYKGRNGHQGHQTKRRQIISVTSNHSDRDRYWSTKYWEIDDNDLDPDIDADNSVTVERAPLQEGTPVACRRIRASSERLSEGRNSDSSLCCDYVLENTMYTSAGACAASPSSNQNVSEDATGISWDNEISFHPVLGRRQSHDETDKDASGMFATIEDLRLTRKSESVLLREQSTDVSDVYVKYMTPNVSDNSDV